VTKAIVIDTNLLLLLIVGLTSPEYIKRHRRLKHDYTSDHFHLLQNWVNQAPKILCTTHILTETSNLIRQVSDPMCSEIMTTFKEFIQSAEEPVIPAKEAARSMNFTRLGLTDAALLSLDPRAVRLLTVDHDLRVACSGRGFEVINLTPLFYE
jgi:hypothetical protein